ncbi:MAG: hypothetical protein AAFN70_12265 [Planctomycetota bacterium]
MKNVLQIGFLVLVAGCVHPATTTPKDDYARERAVAEVVLASITDVAAPSDELKIGKCPACNDPPGACGVGKTGDGRVCDRCLTCGGDGRIDQRDIDAIASQQQEYTEGSGESIVTLEAPKKIVLRVPNGGGCTWASDWFRDSRQAFTKTGWSVTAVNDPGDEAESPYFVVTDAFGERSFFDPQSLGKLLEKHDED